jgi:hypothetical protein
MRAAFWICLVVSGVTMFAGACAPAGSVLQLIGVLGGMVLFGAGGVLMVVVAAGDEPVWTDVQPWGDGDE